MKTSRLVKTTLLAVVAMLSTSCEVYDVYTSYGYSNGHTTISTSVAWTSASYDANGFPIYGYAYGRPVYGYTVSGSPIFSINLLYAGCYVPDWRPAPWCVHHHHYPSGCHHVPKPPKYHHGHNPGHRPKHEPHKGPDHHHHNSKPHHDSGHHHGAQKPDKGHRPGTVSRPDTRPQRPAATTRPQVSRPSTVTRPSTTTRPQVSRPSTGQSRSR